MITKRDLYIQLGEIESSATVLSKIEAAILEAAHKGKHSITWRFSDKVDVRAKREIVATLENCEYTVTCSTQHSMHDSVLAYTPVQLEDSNWLEIFW